jgi:hypothetical protein
MALTSGVGEEPRPLPQLMGKRRDRFSSSVLGTQLIAELAAHHFVRCGARKCLNQSDIIDLEEGIQLGFDRLGH